jgi:hypothetical protein
MSALDAISQIVYFLHVMWVFSSFLLDIMRHSGIRLSPLTLWTRRELNPGYAIGVRPLFGLAMGLFCCWAYAHDEDDDDRWKKRRQKLAAKVAVLGGRLQVVPVRA